MDNKAPIIKVDGMGRVATVAAVAASGMVALAIFQRWYRSRYVPKEVERLHAACLGAIDACLEEYSGPEAGEDRFDALPEGEKEVVRNAQYNAVRGAVGIKVRRMRAIDRAAVAAKNHFGLLEMNDANRKMVGQYIRAWMVELGMRPSHVVESAPMATTLALCPTTFEVEAKQAEGSMSMRSRLAAFDADWAPSPVSSVKSFMASMTSSFSRNSE